MKYKLQIINETGVVVHESDFMLPRELPNFTPNTVPNTTPYPYILPDTTSPKFPSPHPLPDHAPTDVVGTCSKCGRELRTMDMYWCSQLGCPTQHKICM